MKRLTSLFTGRASAPPESAIHDRLKACAVPYESAVETLVAHYGTHPLGWAPDIDICVLEGAAPFIRAQSGPMVFELAADTNPQAPPAMLRCAVRSAASPALNYAKAISELSKLFGRGQEVEHPERVQRRWSLGGVEMICFVHPPDRPVSKTRERRIAMFPDRADEAAIHIFPNL
ncbi:MAG: hypothetical protein AAF340_12670 [Pseudomonadota bacterium]